VSETIQLLINGIDKKYDKLGRKIKIKQQNSIPEMIPEQLQEQERVKTEKIMIEIDKIMKQKRNCAWCENQVHIHMKNG